MNWSRIKSRTLRQASLVCAFAIVCAGVAALAAPLDPPILVPEPLPPVLTLDRAVNWALRNNPSLAAQRQQHGIAAAQVVIADTYPFNPSLENRIQDASGPASAGISNLLPLEHLLLLEVETRGQRRYRVQSAEAALSRTDWQIVSQEQTVAVAVMRAFTTMLYRQEKLRLLEEALRFNEQLLADTRKLMTTGRLTGADLIIAQTEVTAARDLVGGGREALLAARYDLSLALGVVEDRFQLEGTFELPLPALNPTALQELALECRGDLRATQAAAAEAEANLRLTMANRYGNPIVGPAFTYDPTRVAAVGIQVNIPLPILNTHRGDIWQRQAEITRAVLDLRQTEIAIRQVVISSLARLEAAQERAGFYRTTVLPELNQGVEDMQRLFRAGVAGADVLRISDVHRKLLTARDLYVDTLYRATQARVDLIAALGVPSLSICGVPAASLFNEKPLPAAP